MFNDYFSQQCTPLDGNPLPVFTQKTSLVLSEVPVNESDIKSALKSLNPNKSHGWDDISIRMVQMSGDSLIAPLLIIYKNCILKGIFSSVWTMANVVPIHKRNKKTFLPTIGQFHFYKLLVKYLSD